MENREMKLIEAIFKFIVKHLDYVFVLIAFPILFDVKFFDLKVIIAVAMLVFIRAIMPVAKEITKWNSEEEVVYEPEPKPVLKVDDVPVARAEFPKKEFVPQSDIISQAIIDTTNLQLKMIRFGEGAEQINIKKVEGDIILSDGPYEDKSQVIVSFSDFRTIRLRKDEVKRLYVALLESEYKFFQPGKWYLAITAKPQ